MISGRMSKHEGQGATGGKCAHFPQQPCTNAATRTSTAKTQATDTPMMGPVRTFLCVSLLPGVLSHLQMRSMNRAIGGTKMVSSTTNPTTTNSRKVGLKDNAWSALGIVPEFCTQITYMSDSG